MPNGLIDERTSLLHVTPQRHGSRKMRSRRFHIDVQNTASTLERRLAGACSVSEFSVLTSVRVNHEPSSCVMTIPAIRGMARRIRSGFRAHSSTVDASWNRRRCTRASGDTTVPASWVVSTHCFLETDHSTGVYRVIVNGLTVQEDDIEYLPPQSETRRSMAISSIFQSKIACIDTTYNTQDRYLVKITAVPAVL